MLSGVRVIDFTNYIPGPFATLRLAELGADIVKVESLDGDPARTTGVAMGEVGPVFRAMNRGKKSIAIDLKKTEGLEIIIDLIKRSDVLVESFRPGVMKKLGLGYEDVKEIKPDIVYCSISGYGQEGRLSKLGSHDINYLALSGVLAQLKGKDGVPTHPSITFADYYGSFAANERILAGLVSKGLTGKGSYHSISITDIMTSLMGNHAIVAAEKGYQNGLSILNGTIISYCIYKTKDDRYVSLGALEHKFWCNFCSAIKREDLIAAHYPKANDSNPVFKEIQSVFSSRTFDEWTEFSREVDCCMAPVLEVSELKKWGHETVYTATWGDEQIKMHSDIKTDTKNSRQEAVVGSFIENQMGKIEQAELNDSQETPPPSLGENNFEILSKFLNITEDKYFDITKKKIIKILD